MPQLKPEDTTMIGLTLFNQLCQLARIANASLDNPLSDEQVGYHSFVCYSVNLDTSIKKSWAASLSVVQLASVCSRCHFVFKIIVIAKRWMALVSTVQVCGIDQLWGIALRAQNTDVSLTAIQCLNNHYINCKWITYMHLLACILALALASFFMLYRISSIKLSG